MKTRLLGLPGSEEFMEAYQNALAKTGRTANKSPLDRGSFGYVCRLYYASVAFKGLDISTQRWRRRSLDEIAVQHGDKPLDKMQPKHVRQLRDEKADKPGAARNRVKALRALFIWAIENDEAKFNPTRDIKLIRHVTKDIMLGARRRSQLTRTGIRYLPKPDWRWRCYFTRPAAVKMWCDLAHSTFAKDGFSIVKRKTSIAIRSTSTFRCIPTCKKSSPKRPLGT